MQPAPTLHAAILAEAQARDRNDSAVIATDDHGSIVYWNEHASSLYGWPADEAMGKNILDVTPTRNTADEAARIMEELHAGRTWSGRFIAQRRDGSPIV